MIRPALLTTMGLKSSFQRKAVGVLMGSLSLFGVGCLFDTFSALFKYCLFFFPFFPPTFYLSQNRTHDCVPRGLTHASLDYFFAQIVTHQSLVIFVIFRKQKNES